MGMQPESLDIEKIQAENRRLKQALSREKDKNRSLQLKLQHRQAMLETTAEGAFIMTETFVDCNSQACKIWKTQKNEIIGKSPADFAPLYQPNGEKSHDMAKRKVRSALSGNPQRFFWKDKLADGSIIDTEVFLKQVIINGKKHVSASIRDVTQSKSKEKNSIELIKKMALILGKRKKALARSTMALKEEQENIRMVERELELADTELQHAFETADNGLVLFDNHRNVLKVNSAFSRLTGVMLDKRGSQKCYDLFPCKGCEKGLKCRAEELLLKSDRAEFETRCINHKGEIIPYIVFARSLRDYSGQRVGTLQSFKDLGSYKSGVDQLKASEEMHRVILSTISDAVFIVNDEGNFFFISPSVKNIFGFTQEEVWWMDNIETLLGKRFFSLEELDEKRKITSSEITVLDKSGKEHHIVASVKRANIGGGTILISCHDITEEKIRSRQLEQAGKMVTLGILVAGMGHEINNPNQYIGLNAPLLSRVWNDAAQILDNEYEAHGEFYLGGLKYSMAREKIPGLFGGIITGSRRIKAIVSDLKNYSRQDVSGQDNIVYLNSVVKHSLTLVNNQIKNSTHDLRVDYAKGKPRFKGNFQQIEQVIINLVQNACEALTEKSQSLRITTGMDEITGTVSLEVKDQGEGISPGDLDHVTDPFFTTKRCCGGTGLGLSISEKIIKEHGGGVRFISASGKGTTVRVLFPPLP
ncbi:MAG: PAS domain S-box protein [Desulfobacteraceae bacterium]|nr:PAS domain S-box protein [Desulfobacteraceae bacterium]